MSIRNEERIEAIRINAAKDPGVGGYFNNHEIRLLLNEIDYRNMVITDLCQESTAYERGRQDAIAQLRPPLLRCLKELEEHNNEYGYVTLKDFLIELRVICGLTENNG